MTPRPATPLRLALSRRLAGTALAAAVVLVALLASVYTVQREHAAAAWLADARQHFDRQSARQEAEWLREAELLRSQIDFNGVLDGDDDALGAARLTALLASLGGQGRFTHVLLRDADGRHIVSYATRTGDPLPVLPPAGALWTFSSADRLLYRVLQAPLRLGSRGTGSLLLFVPLNNALLDEIGFPEARVSLRWQDQEELAKSRAAAASDAAGGRWLTASFPWGGAAGGPVLQVERLAPEVLPLSALLPLAAGGLIGSALLAWLAIGRWAGRHVERIGQLSEVISRFAADPQGAPPQAAALQAAGDGADAELRELADGLASMMRATQAAQAERAAANDRLAELNAHLEARVLQRTAELAVARDEALAAARTKEQILAGVSHELRTPLVGLLGGLELADLDAMPGEQRRLIEVARRSGQALRHVIDDVLDYSRLEAVGAELRQLPFRVDDVVAESAALQAAVALNKGLRLTCHCSEAAARTVRGDPARLRQVLLNLIGNAVKFTDSGQIEVRADAVPTPDAGRLALRIQVRDTGIGIDDASRERLFSPFARADNAQQQARSGTGLGLAISQRLVVAMGGRIEVDSRPGAGSTFSFTLSWPLAEVTPPPAAAQASPPLRSGRVLLVEDNAVNRIVAGEMLRRLGVEVEEAENGLLAIEALRRRRADLVLMDQLLPVLDGPAAAARIRAGEAGPDAAQVPIVAVTANDASENDPCRSAGMNDRLPKPFTQAELAAVLRRWLQPSDAQA